MHRHLFTDITQANTELYLEPWQTSVISFRKLGLHGAKYASDIVVQNFPKFRKVCDGVIF